MRILILLLIPLMAILLYSAPNRCSDGNYMRLGSQEYCVPSENSIYMEDGVFSFLFMPNKSSLDRGDNQEILSINTVELQEHIPNFDVKKNNYGNQILNFKFLVFSMNAEDLDKADMVPRTIAEKIFGLGEWADLYQYRHITKIPGSSWFNVSFDRNQDGTPEGSWYILNHYPDLERDTHLVLGGYIASCRKRKFSDIPLPSECRAEYIDRKKGLLIEFSLREHSLHLRDEVGRFLVDKLDSWNLGSGGLLSAEEN